MWSILVNILHELERNVYSAVIGWHSPWMSTTDGGVEFNYIRTDCPLILSISGRGVLKSLTMVVNSSISPYNAGF